MPLAASTTIRSGVDLVEIDEGEHLVDESGPDVERRDLAPLRDRAEACLRARAHLLEAGVATHGQRARADDLHARVLLRVVRGGDADAAVEPELADRVVDHLGADHSEVVNIGAAVRRALHHGRGHRGSRDAHVAPDGDRAGLEMLDVGAADRVGAFLVQLRAVEAANVVRLEDPGVEHAIHRIGVAPHRWVMVDHLSFRDGTEACDRPLRRPRRLDAARRERRSRGGSLAHDAVLRRGLPLHHGARRDRPEIRGRRGDGRVRGAVRARGRPGAGGARRARNRRGGARARPRGPHRHRVGRDPLGRDGDDIRDRARDQRRRATAAGRAAG